MERKARVGQACRGRLPSHSAFPNHQKDKNEGTEKKTKALSTRCALQTKKRSLSIYLLHITDALRGFFHDSDARLTFAVYSLSEIALGKRDAGIKGKKMSLLRNNKLSLNLPSF